VDMRYELASWPTNKPKRIGTDFELLKIDLIARDSFQLRVFRDDGVSVCVLGNDSFVHIRMLPDNFLVMDMIYAHPEDIVEMYLENGLPVQVPRHHCISPRQRGIAAAWRYFRGTRLPSSDWFPYDAKLARGRSFN
jgi:hypothetical protein